MTAPGWLGKMPPMRFHLVPALLTLSLAAGETPQAEQPSSSLSLSAGSGFVAALLTAKPISLLADPEAAKAVASAQRNIELLERQANGAPPVLTTLRCFLGGRFEAWLANPAQQPEPGRELIRMWMDLQPVGREAWKTWWSKQRNFMREEGEQATDGKTIGPFVGRVVNQIFWGQAGQRVVIGHPDLIPGADLATLAPAQENAFQLHLDARSMPRLLLRELRSEQDQEVTDLAFPGWRTFAPVFDLSMQVQKGSLVTTASLGGEGALPVHPCDPKLLALGKADAQIVIAAGLHPGLIALSAAAAASGFRADEPKEFDSALKDGSGLTMAELSALLTGDLLIEAGWTAGPFPQGFAALRLKDGEAAGRALERFAKNLDLPPAELKGSRQAWSLLTPAGIFTIARAGDLLLFANDADRAAALAAGTPGGLKSAPGCALLVQDDAQAIGRQWLPMAMGLLAGQEERLGRDPLMVIGWSLQNLERSDALPASITPSSILLGEKDNFWRKDALREVFPKSEPAVIDAAIAIYAKELPETEGRERSRWEPRRQLRMVLRSPGGFLILPERMGRPSSKPKFLDQAGLETTLAGFTRLAGPEPANLAETVLPESAWFDRTWLPPLPVVLRHLPQHRLELTVGKEGTHLREEGLPLGGSLLTVGACAIWAGLAQVEARERWEAERQEQGKVREHHLMVLDSVQAMAKALRRLKKKGEFLLTEEQRPKRLSELVGKGLLTLEDCAGLFGGQVPAKAEELDQVGRWYPKGDQLWAVKLEEGWFALIDTGCNVQVVKRTLDAPPLPKGSATRSETMF